MALPVLDGNQSATTLSSVVTGGEHIVAHTVVSLGSTAISNITNAVSGSVVSISNFPSTQTIAGTVTANVVGTRTFVDANAVTVSGFLTVGGWDDVSSQYAPIPLTDGGFGVKIGFDDVNGAPIQVINHPSLPLSATVTVGNSVTIGSLPAISGTVTANVQPQQADDNDPNWKFIPIGFGTADAGAGLDVWRGVSQIAPLPVSNYGSVTIGSLPAISGTVTANNVENIFGSTEIYLTDADTDIKFSSANPFPISGTVTAAAPNGSLTTRFGTPTTANTAFATAAVTKSDRKYLLIQNVTTGSNVITVGIGFTPTTTQGIQLTAGAGITFESSYIPTGAVQILSSVTASNFTILEA